MPYRVDFDQNKGVIYFEATDIFTGEDLFKATLEIIDHPDFDPQLNLLADLDPIKSFRISANDVRNLVDFYQTIKGRIGYGKYAIVTRSNLIYGMARMYQILTDRMPFEVRVFREMMAAREWLDLT